MSHSLRSNYAPYLIVSALSLFSAGSCFAESQLNTWGGLCVYDKVCPDYWFAINGRLEFDEIVFMANYRNRQNNFPTSGNLRRGYVGLNGGVGDCFDYNLTLDFGRSHANFDLITDTINGNSVFVPNNINRASISIVEEAWLGYRGFECTRIRFGQFTPITSMDGYGNYNMTSGQMFLESALETMAFDVPSYVHTSSRSMKGFGVIVETGLCDSMTFAATIYQPAIGPFFGSETRRSDRPGEAVKLTYAPLNCAGEVLHFGVLGRYQSYNHRDDVHSLDSSGNFVLHNLFFTPPEVLPRNYVGVPVNGFLLSNGVFGASANSDPNLVNAGPLRARAYTHVAGEIASIWGPLTLQGEYHYVAVNRKQSPLLAQTGNVSFHGWHMQAGYVLTGESRGYDFKTGRLCGIRPTYSAGAFELAARYSYVNLFSKDIYGGAEHNTTLGLNWYINDNVRFTFNYLFARIQPTGTIAGIAPDITTIHKRTLHILGSRLQVVF